MHLTSCGGDKLDLSSSLDESGLSTDLGEDKVLEPVSRKRFMIDSIARSINGRCRSI